MKARIFAILIIALLVMGFVLPKSHGGETAAKATLPGFTITLNGTVIDNKTSQYPFLSYKDITYFPMTYYDCRFLGLESIWHKNGELHVAKTGVGWDYHKYQATGQNADSYYTVKEANFSIKVNGKDIDNAKEEYPLLIFRNVTYFPLTWRFAVEEFGWEYDFDKKRGLVINSNDGERAAGQLSLPIVTRENGQKGAFTMAGDYFYYEGLTGGIYQASVKNPLDKKQVYQLPEVDYGTRFAYATLKTEKGKALLRYRTGGTVMGAYHLVLLAEDGSFTSLKVYSNLKESLFPGALEGSQLERLAVESVNPGGKLKSLEKQNGYTVAIFDKSSKSQYKMMIFDDDGEVVYKTMENVLTVTIENGKVAFVKDN